MTLQDQINLEYLRHQQLTIALDACWYSVKFS